MGEVVILPIERRESDGLAAQEAACRAVPPVRSDAEVAAERAKRKAARRQAEE